MSELSAPPGTKRLTRAEQVERNRRLLLDSAGKVFRDAGYAKATLEQIAEDAGFSKGVIYSQFDSKADLFLTLLEERIERRAERQLARARDLVAEQGPEGFLLGMLNESRGDPAWRLLVIEFRVVAARDPILNERYRRAHRRTVDGVVEAMRIVFEVTRREPYLPLDKLALCALAMENGAYLEEVAEPDLISLADSVAVSARLIGLELGPRTDASEEREESDDR